MIKGMSLPLSSRPPINLTSEHFEMMPNLRFLNISSANFMGDFSRLPFGLRCFTWIGDHRDVLPTNFYHKRLVYLNVSGSNVEQLWNIRPQNENQRFQNLKVLDLSCENLSKCPDFSWFPYLEQLNLGACNLLEELDQSIRQLSQLKSLILKDCGSLKRLPECIGDLKSLFKLELSFTQIEELPDSISRMNSLKELILMKCKSLKKLPDLSELKNLTTLNLNYCNKLEKIRGLGGTESLEELDALRCYKLTHTSRRIQGTLFLPDKKSLAHSYSYSVTANDGIYNNGFILCLVLESFSILEYNLNLEESYLLSIYINISVSIQQKDKKIRCHHTLRIKDLEYTNDRDIIYIHHFKGFDWFGIPLQETDGIEILNIGTRSGTVKFCEILFKNREPIQQKLNRQSSALMVTDRFRWSYADDDGGVVTLIYWPTPNQQEKGNRELDQQKPNQCLGILMVADLPYDNDSGVPTLNCRAIPDLVSCLGCHSVSEVGGVEEDILKPSTRTHLQDNDDEALGPSPSMSLTCWLQAGDEGSNCAPKEREVEGVSMRASNSHGASPNDEDEVASFPFLSLALTPPCVVLPLNDGSNQQSLNSPSLVQENEKTSSSENTQEEKQRNNSAVDLLSCLGLDSVSDVIEEEGEMLRPSKRVRHLHDNVDEAPGPSLSLSLTCWS